MEATFAQRGSPLSSPQDGLLFLSTPAPPCRRPGPFWFLRELGEMGGVRRACSAYPEKLLQGKVLLFSAQNVRIRASELSERDLTGLSAQALGSVKKLSVGLAVFLP